MFTGRDGLHSLDAALRKLRADETDLTRQLERATARKRALGEDYAARVKELAQFRLDRLASDALAKDLDAADGQARELVERRQEAMREAEARLGQGRQALDAIEAQRETQANALEAVSEDVDEAAAELQEQLAKDPDHAARLKAVEAAQAVAARAAEKTGLAEQDRVEKGKPYEGDALFAYLWARGYGTASYRAGPVARLLDAWVARLCGYQAARPSYAMLLEIPKRLAEHAARMQEKVDAAVAALRTLEEAAREKSPLPALDARLAEARAGIEALDAEIAEAKAELGTAQADLDRYHAEEDELSDRALDLMVAALETQEIQDLRRSARETPQPNDERIVRDLARLDTELERAEEDRLRARDFLYAAQRRREELEDMRVEYRRRHYDDYGSVFEDDQLFGSLLEEFLRGLVSGATYWGRLERGRHHRPRRSRKDFGSAGFGLPGPIGFPDFPSPGGSGRGGFGDDDFKTGGGF